MTEAEQKANDYCIELEKNGFSCGSCIIDCPNKDFMQNVVKVDDFFEEIKKAYIAGHEQGVNTNRYLKEALIAEQQKVNKMKVCGNCVHIRECDRHEHTHIRICDDWQYNEYCQEKPMFR